MCGIVGIFDMRGKSFVDANILKAMNDSLIHRGPDEGDVYSEPGVGLGHRRLSIIDLEGGLQPLFNEDSSVVVVYNGEIYNYRELTRELKQAGHVFRTNSDTEVIVHAWEEWGEKCVDRFRGMFAFSIWDRNNNTLFLARDRLGIKPLYYAETNDGKIVFGSELKSILKYPNIVKKIDPCAVEEYFAFGYIPEPKTIYQQVQKLSPGHYISFSRNSEKIHQVQYWDVPFVMHDKMSEEQVQDELIHRIKEAINIRLVSEVPLGAFLSGGVDSSAVVALMSGMLTDPVKTCSISFGDPAFNEVSYSNMVADKYNTDHIIGNVDPDDFSLIDELAYLYDEPFADSSAIPTYRVCQLARKSVTVALSGDGGDENFAGYRRYRWHLHEERMRNMLPYQYRKIVFGLMAQMYPKMDWAPKMFRAKATLQALARNSIHGYMHGISFLSKPFREKIYSRSFRNVLQGYDAVEVLERHARNSPTDNPMSLVQYLDLKTYLPGDILTKVDRASMAHSLEVRVPLLDHKLVEWISGLQPDMKLRSKEGKYIFKKSLEKYLPKEILYRKKMGFSVPLSEWFRGPLREKVEKSLRGEMLNDSGYFNTDQLNKIIVQHQRGIRDHSTAIWSLMMFDAFLQKNSKA